VLCLFHGMEWSSSPNFCFVCSILDFYPCPLSLGDLLSLRVISVMARYLMLHSLRLHVEFFAYVSHANHEIHGLKTDGDEKGSSRSFFRLKRSGPTWQQIPDDRIASCVHDGERNYCYCPISGLG